VVYILEYLWAQYFWLRGNSKMNYQQSIDYIHAFALFFLTFIPIYIYPLSVPTVSFTPRCQGRDKVMQIVGMAEHTHLFDIESWYGTFSLTPEYRRSFRSLTISQALFDPFIISSDAPAGSSLAIQGSAVVDRNPNALVADNFYLPDDFDSVVSIRPQISNFLINIDFYFGLDEWLNGLYIRIYGPFVRCIWDLQLDERINDPGVSPYAAGVFGNVALERKDLLANFTCYATGHYPSTITNSDIVTKLSPLKYAQLTTKSVSENRFAQLRTELGWDCINDDDYHLGINAQMAFPAGHNKRSELLFAPKIGLDKWELGVGSTGHYTLWHSYCTDSFFGIFFDANLTHIFMRSEQRTFDLMDKPLSRYLLAEKCDTNTQALSGLEGTELILATSQFAYQFCPVANLTSRQVSIGYGLQADIVCWINAYYQGISWDIGYNFWARSREKLQCTHEMATHMLDGSTWGLKGTAQVIGFATGATGPISINDPIALSATQSMATINSVIINQNNSVTPSITNIGIDLPEQAFVGSPPVGLSNAPGIPLSLSIINTSIQPMLLCESDIHFQRLGRSLSHKFFTHIQYTWDQACWVPYLGIGGYIECGDQHSRSNYLLTQECVTMCPKGNALSEWAVWVKGGVSFN